MEKNEDRKPLMLLGARQVGKTHILEEFGKTYEKTYYFNLEENKEVRKIFDDGKSIEEIYKKIQVKVGGKIDRSNSLLILDEIQVSEKAVIMLKYFCENYRDLHIV